MKAAAERDDRLALRVLARELDRRFDRLRARVPEEHRVEPARRHCAESFGERDVRLVGRDAGGDVHQLRGLLADRSNDLRVRVPDIRDGDATGEIENAAAILRDEPASFTAVQREPGIPARER